MVWAVILLCGLGVVIYLLCMPLQFCLNSYQDRYYLRFGGLGQASLERDPAEVVQIHLKVLFMNFYIKPSQLRSWGSRKKAGQPKRKGSAFPKLNWMGILRSFEVKRFKLEIDTGDLLLNARLYPICALVKNRLGDVQINFQNRNQILLEVFNRPIYILKAIINQ